MGGYIGSITSGAFSRVWVLGLAVTCTLVVGRCSAYLTDNSPGRRDAEVTRAWSEACGFFAALDARALDLTCPRVRFAHARELRDANGAAVLARYYLESDSIVVCTYSSYRLNRGAWLGTRPSPALYRSFLVHEFAHALAIRINPNLPVAKQEYIAYVTQISTLPAAVRDELLDRFAGRGFDSPARVTALNLALMGPRFGIACYRLHTMYPDLFRPMLENDEGALRRRFPVEYARMLPPG